MLEEGSSEKKEDQEEGRGGRGNWKFTRGGGLELTRYRGVGGGGGMEYEVRSVLFYSGLFCCWVYISPKEVLLEQYCNWERGSL